MGEETIEVQQPSEEQINVVLRQLRDEKDNNTELRQTVEQLNARLKEKDEKLKALAVEMEFRQQLLSQSGLQSEEFHPKEEETTPNEKSQSVEQPQPQQEHFDKAEKLLSEIHDSLDSRVKELVAVCNELSCKLDDKTVRYQELIERVQEDRYRKDKVKILRRNINMRNLVASVLDDYRHDIPREQGYDTPAALFLEQQLEKIIEKIDADLRQEMLVPLINGLEGTDFDAECQEIVDRQPTDHPELDGKVYRSVAPGYVWTLPYIFKPRVNESGEEVHSYKFLLRSEDVITYKYVKPEETKQ